MLQIVRRFDTNLYEKKNGGKSVWSNIGVAYINEILPTRLHGSEIFWIVWID